MAKRRLHSRRRVRKNKRSKRMGGSPTSELTSVVPAANAAAAFTQAGRDTEVKESITEKIVTLTTTLLSTGGQIGEGLIGTQAASLINAINTAKMTSSTSAIVAKIITPALLTLLAPTTIDVVLYTSMVILVILILGYIANKGGIFPTKWYNFLSKIIKVLSLIIAGFSAVIVSAGVGTTVGVGVAAAVSSPLAGGVTGLLLGIAIFWGGYILMKKVHDKFHKLFTSVRKKVRNLQSPSDDEVTPFETEPEPTTQIIGTVGGYKGGSPINASEEELRLYNYLKGRSKEPGMEDLEIILALFNPQENTQGNTIVDDILTLLNMAIKHVVGIIKSCSIASKNEFLNKKDAEEFASGADNILSYDPELLTPLMLRNYGAAQGLGGGYTKKRRKTRKRTNRRKTKKRKSRRKTKKRKTKRRTTRR